MNKFCHIIYYPLCMLIMQAYPNSGHMRDFGQKMQLWLYARLRSEDATSIRCPTPVVCSTLVARCNSGCLPDSSRKMWLSRMPDSGQKTRLQLYAQLRSKGVTSVVCLTPVKRCDSGHMPNSGHKYMTPVIDYTACFTYSFVKDFTRSI
jgi:hypothetical protein